MTRPPRQGTKRWKAVIDRGCGYYYRDYDGDFDCAHDYPWTCDNCPMQWVFRGKELRNERQAKSVVGRTDTKNTLGMR